MALKLHTHWWVRIAGIRIATCSSIGALHFIDHLACPFLQMCRWKCWESGGRGAQYILSGVRCQGRSGQVSRSQLL